MDPTLRAASALLVLVLTGCVPTSQSDDGGVDAAGDAASDGDAGASPQGTPVVLVHGYLGQASDWDAMRAGLAERGRDPARLFAVELGNTNDSIIDLAGRLQTFVDGVVAATGSARVDVVGHSLGGIVLRYWIATGNGGSHVATAITIAGANHGNDNACATELLGASSRQLCPAYASAGEADDDLQVLLNGDPDTADVDETPAGSDPGRPIRWFAYHYLQDLIVLPTDAQCLDQASRGDCSAPANRQLDLDGTSHTGLISDDRVIDLIAADLDP